MSKPSPFPRLFLIGAAVWLAVGAAVVAQVADGVAARLAVAALYQLVGQRPDPEAAALLAIESLRREHTAGAAVALSEANRQLLPVRRRIDTERAVTLLSFSADGALVTGAFDRAASWRTSDGARLNAWTGSSISRPAVSARVIAIHGSTVPRRDGLSLYDLSTGKPLTDVKASPDAMAFSGDGSVLVTAENIGGLGEARRGAIIARDASTAAELQRMPFSGHVRQVRVSARAEFIAAVTFDKASIWHRREQRVVADLVQLSERALAFSPDEQWFAAGQAGGDLILLNTATGAQSTLPTRHANSVTFAPDNSMLAVASDAGLVFIDVTTGRVRDVLFRGAGVQSVAFATEGTTVLAGFGDGLFRAFDLSEGREIGHALHSAAVEAIAVGPQGLIAAGDSAGYVNVYQLPSPAVPLVSSDETTWSLSFQGHYATGVNSNTEEEHSTVIVVNTIARMTQATVEFDAVVTAAGVSDDGTQVAVVTREGDPSADDDEAVSSVHLIDLATKRPLWKKLVPGSYEHVAFSPMAKHVVASAGEHAVVFSSESGRTAALVTETKYKVVRISSDDRYAVARTEFGVSVWTLQDGVPVRHISLTKEEREGNVLLMPGLEALVVASSTNEVVAINIASGSRAPIFQSSARIYGLASTGDGRHFSAIDSAGVIRVWDTRTRRLANELRSSLKTGQWALDNAGFATVLDYEAKALLIERHPWSADALITTVCKKLSRDLYEDEWEAYLKDEPFRPTCPAARPALEK